MNEGSVDDLGAELGVSARHLRRAMEARLGVSPIALAQTHRLGLAKQLIQDTALPLTEIAFAAGFQSVRRFNAVFQRVMGNAPSKLRRAHASGDAGAGLAIRLDYRPPYAWHHLLGFLAARAIPGVESVRDGVYRRVVRIAGGKPVVGTISVQPHASKNALVLSVSPALVHKEAGPVLMPLVARVRRMFDLDARPDAIARVLGRDPLLAKLVAAQPGLRLPGAIDGFEAAVRAMLGQQVSVAAATTLAGRFAAAFGARIAAPDDDQLFVRFPTADEVVAAGPAAIAKIGLPGTRAAAIHSLAGAVASGALALDSRDVDAFVASAVALPGIGPWTAHYLAMRALHLPDAFPSGDLGVRKALRSLTPRASEAHAERWRPFRSYAVMHLWNGLGGSDDDDVDDRISARRAAPGRTRRRARGGVPAAARTARRR
jgi:AraC family transcriptional regulator, regulatory protein of adaptative response / DNA-3-methyladenine glycosylase II